MEPNGLGERTPTLADVRETAKQLFIQTSTVFIGTESSESDYVSLKEISAKVAIVVMDLDKLLRGLKGRTAARSDQ